MIAMQAPRVYKYVGENGLTVLHQRNPASRAFCIGVWINTGSRDEARGEEGLCHFLEHMVFKGTKTRSAFEISQSIEKVGGSLDAFTTREHVCVYAQVLEDHRNLAIDLLSDMILNPTFPDDQVALERQVVLEEIGDVMDAPDDLIHDLFAAEIFPNHPLGRPILGTPQTVSAFNRAKLQRFAKKHFRTSNVVVSICGDIDKKQIRRLADESFSLPDGPVKRSSRRVGRFRPTRKQVRRKLHHQHICIGSPGYSYHDEKRYPALVLTTLLGGGMSSRLFQKIREELGIAYSVFTYADAARDTGLMGTYVSVKPSNAGRVIREVFSEFDKIRRGALTKTELQDNKEQLKGQILLGLEASSSKMMRMARNETNYGRQVNESELISKIDRVTMDDVMAVAAEALHPSRNTIVSLGPSSAGLTG